MIFSKVLSKKSLDKKPSNPKKLINHKVDYQLSHIFISNSQKQEQDRQLNMTMANSTSL
jgi:hypothetical protein